MPSSNKRWGIVWLLCIGILIAYVDRTNLSVALASKELKEALHLDDAQRGTLNSAFFWFYAFLQIPAGWVVDRYGVKRPLAIGFVFWSLVSGATALVSTFGQLLALRVLLGLGESVVMPASMRWICIHLDESRRGMAVGIFLAGTKFGPAVGAPLAAWLTVSYGWQNMFLILAAGGMLWLIPYWMLVKDDDREIEREQEKNNPAAGMPFLHVFKTPLIWGVLIGSFCYNYFVYHNMTWLPAYFVERRHMSLSSMGWFTMFSFGGTAVIAIISGWLADRMIRGGRDAVKVRRGFTCAGLILASTEVIGAITPSNDVAVFFAVFSMCGLGLATPNYWALTQTLLPGAAIGRVVGIQNFAVNLSGVAAPLVTGWLKQSTGSWEAPMLAILVLLLIALASFVFLVRKEYAPKAV